MSYHLWIKLIAGAALLSLAACGDGGGGGGGDDDDDGGGPGSIQSQFGGTFEGAFNANVNSDPIDPQPGDLPAVSLTADPIDF